MRQIPVDLMWDRWPLGGRNFERVGLVGGDRGLADAIEN